jgi:hypothetical protein
MRRILTMCALVAAFSALALAETWTGRLVDAACYAEQKSAASCDPTSSTTMFALFASGHVYNLDDAGNAKAADAIKSRADRATDPNAATSSHITARITGTKDDETNTLKVETLDVQ